jgi:hypothetical protein
VTRVVVAALLGIACGLCIGYLLADYKRWEADRYGR